MLAGELNVIDSVLHHPTLHDLEIEVVPDGQTSHIIGATLALLEATKNFLKPHYWLYNV
jgi:hypothetical protein